MQLSKHACNQASTHASYIVDHALYSYARKLGLSWATPELSVVSCVNLFFFLSKLVNKSLLQWFQAALVTSYFISKVLHGRVGGVLIIMPLVAPTDELKMS